MQGWVTRKHFASPVLLRERLTDHSGWWNTILYYWRGSHLSVMFLTAVNRNVHSFDSTTKTNNVYVCVCVYLLLVVFEQCFSLFSSKQSLWKKKATLSTDSHRFVWDLLLVWCLSFNATALSESKTVVTVTVLHSSFFSSFVVALSDEQGHDVKRKFFLERNRLTFFRIDFSRRGSNWKKRLSRQFSSLSESRINDKRSLEHQATSWQWHTQPFIMFA